MSFCNFEKDFYFFLIINLKRPSTSNTKISTLEWWIEFWNGFLHRTKKDYNYNLLINSYFFQSTCSRNIGDELDLGLVASRRILHYSIVVNNLFKGFICCDLIMNPFQQTMLIAQECCWIVTLSIPCQYSLQVRLVIDYEVKLSISS